MKSIEIFLDVIELLMRTALPLKNRTCWKYNAFVYDNTERKKVPEKIRCILQAPFCKLHRTCTEHARILYRMQFCLLSDSVEAEIAIEVL